MKKDNDRQQLSRMRWGSQLENLAIVILVFYPLRHINWGLDLWDTGYNYANFQYMGMEHMDSMWLFSTYLANVAGNWLTKLPNADTLMGMNLYTGLFVSVLALTGYFFCTRKLRMPKVTTFVGEMAAISLCWCPTALLYNYLTYVLFLTSFILLYLGFIKEKKGYLIGAGVLLGANVLVRFSNLPEAAMIVAVWAYDFIVWLEGRKHITSSGTVSGVGKAFSVQGKTGAGAGSSAGQKKKADSPTKGFWKRTLWHTLWCLAGYVGALVVLLNYIHIRYGMNEYIAGIQRLFAMTDNATDYKAASMIMGIVKQYVENMYWVIRIGVIAAGGMVLFALTGWLEEWGLQRYGSTKGKNIVRILHVGTRILWVIVSIVMLGWLYYRGFCSLLFYSYDPIWRPGPIFLMLTMFIGVIRIFHKNSPKEEKLLSGMLILVILLTSIGSNNGVLPSLNNLFIAAPYTFWESWRFVRYVGDKEAGGGVKLCSFPAKVVLTAFLVLCLFQFGMFGAKFVFAEATGVQNATAAVDNNDILRNIKMNPQKAQWMSELSAYVNENSLEGNTVILYGKIPALSYYLQMPSAFNPWSDLTSYSLVTMEKDLAQLRGQITEKGAERPVVIVENIYALQQEGAYRQLPMLPEAIKNIYTPGRMGVLAELKFSESNRQKVEQDEKWKLLVEFMEAFGYEQTFRNEKFAVYR